MISIDRRTRPAVGDRATEARIAAMALEQEARACTGSWARVLRAAAARRRAEAVQTDFYLRGGVA